MIGLRRALWGLAIAGAVVLGTQIVLISEANFAGDHGLWIALDVFIGAGFVGVGLFAWYRRPDNRVGSLMVATGFAWFAGLFSLTDPPLLFTVGAMLNNLFVAAAIHLLLAFPSGRLLNRVDRGIVAFAYLTTTLLFIPPMLAYDPAAHGCSGCPENVFLLEGSPSFFDRWFEGLGVLGILTLSVVLFRLFGRWRTATPPLRRIVTPLFVAGGMLMALLAALLFLGLFGVETDEWLWYAALIPFGLVPYLFLGSLVRARMLRGGAVGELVATIGGRVPAQKLRDALALALNDPALELAYWIPESERYVDSTGRRIDCPEKYPGRATSEVRLEDGRLVAMLIHDAQLLDEPELIEAVGGAAALALEKERLDAELRAKVAELRESRVRMIAFGLAERRRLERDLHDGAQQRLVSLALDLRLAKAAVRDDPGRAEELLTGAADELSRALEELRELARGIHPAVLSDRGLDPALEALASRTPLPVEVHAKIGERLNEPVELAAYYVVAEALTNVVKYAHAERASITVGRDNGTVEVEVADDGIGGADPSTGTGLRGLADRVNALGGRLEVSSEPGRGTRVTASIPCE